MIKVGILTISDKASSGERVDKSGMVIKEMITSALSGEIKFYQVVPDEKEIIKESLIKMGDELNLDLILTCGGTGFSPRDVTPEATLQIIDKEVPGIPEIMRIKGYQHTPRAMLSRAVAGIRKKSLIINLPGSEKGVRESLEVIIPVLPHAMEVLQGKTGE